MAQWSIDRAIKCQSARSIDCAVNVTVTTARSIDCAVIDRSRIEGLSNRSIAHWSSVKFSSILSRISAVCRSTDGLLNAFPAQGQVAFHYSAKTQEGEVWKERHIETSRLLNASFSQLRCSTFRKVVQFVNWTTFPCVHAWDKPIYRPFLLQISYSGDWSTCSLTFSQSSNLLLSTAKHTIALASNQHSLRIKLHGTRKNYWKVSITQYQILNNSAAKGERASSCEKQVREDICAKSDWTMVGCTSRRISSTAITEGFMTNWNKRERRMPVPIYAPHPHTYTNYKLMEELYVLDGGVTTLASWLL